MGRNYRLRNQIPYELALIGHHDVVRLAPLERITVRDHPMALFDDAALYARHDRAVDWEVEPPRETKMFAIATLTTVAGVGLVAAAVVRLVAHQRAAVDVGAAIWVVLYVVGVAWCARLPSKRPDETARHTALDTREDGEDGWDRARDIAVSALQGSVMPLLLALAVAVPAAAIYYGTDVSTIIVLRHGHLALIRGAGHEYVVVARCLQLVLVTAVSLVPALMFFQFDREKLSTLIDRWLHAMFRLDPSLHCVADVDAKYGRRVEEFLGTSLMLESGQLQRRLRSRSPVIVVTTLTAIGWIVVLLGSSPGSNTEPTFQELFQPSVTPMTLAFLGSYFLAVQVTLRGYVRGDLKPKTYNVLTVRMLMAVILAGTLWALTGSNSATLAASFLAGITPNTVLRRIRDISVFDWAKAKLPQDAAAEDDVGCRSPLSSLDEIDVYERTRLEEEGITCVQALARHDLVDLMLSTRIPVARLVDWMDQAVLAQHVGESLPRLRALGVRTATDYLRVYDRAVENGGAAGGSGTSAGGGETLAALTTALCGAAPQVLHTVLSDDEWLSYVRNWRDNATPRSGPVTVYGPDGTRTHVARDATGTAPSMRDLTESLSIDLSAYEPAVRNGHRAVAPLPRTGRTKSEADA